MMSTVISQKKMRTRMNDAVAMMTVAADITMNMEMSADADITITTMIAIAIMTMMKRMTMR